MYLAHIVIRTLVCSLELQTEGGTSILKVSWVWSQIEQLWAAHTHTHTNAEREGQYEGQNPDLLSRCFDL